MTPSQPALELGLQHHRAGNLSEAEAIYRQILDADPSHADALYLLAEIAMQYGRYESAIEYMNRAIELKPGMAGLHLNLAVAYHAVGRPADALASAQRALDLDPASPEAHNNLAALKAEFGRHEEAIAHYQYAVRVKPDYADANCNLGHLFLARSRFGEAASTFREFLQVNPRCAQAHHGLGLALVRLESWDEAIASFGQALGLDPNFALAYADLGATMHLLGNQEQALAYYLKAARLKPDNATALSGAGVVLDEMGRIQEALPYYDRAAALVPHDPMIRWNRALGFLRAGDFDRGWPEFEWRLEYLPERLKRDFAQPRWDGSKLAGRTLLLHAEGGFGDALHFVRYVPLVARRGGRLLLECAPELDSLFRSVAGLERVVVRGEPLPEFDVHCPLQTLPMLFGTKLETIPADIPYLWADPGRVEFWRSQLPNDGRCRVGIAWAGSIKAPRRGDPNWSFDGFRLVAQVPDVTFYSLQKGECAVEAWQRPWEMALVDRSAELRDFADTAALMMNLDLVISVDTSIVHLAGALGRSVWNIVHHYTDFRWLLERRDSPWYPTMTLFRQRRPGDWEPVMAGLALELRSFLSERRIGKKS